MVKTLMSQGSHSFYLHEKDKWLSVEMFKSIQTPSTAIVSEQGFHLKWLTVLTFVPVHCNWRLTNDCLLNIPQFSLAG